MNKIKIMGASVATILTVGALTGAFIVKPKAEAYIRPLVREKLNTTIDGTIAYSSLDLSWTGVNIKNIIVKDKSNQTILTAKKASVGISPIGTFKVLVQSANPLRALGNVEIDNPVINAVQETKENWNITSLIKKKKEDKEPMAYRGDIIINNGVLNLQPLGKHKLTITDINGVAKLDSYPMLKGAVTASINKDKVSATFSYGTKTRAYRLFVSSKIIDLAFANDFIPENLEIKSINAKAKDVAMTVTYANDVFAVDGQATLDITNAKYKDYILSDASVEINGDGEKLALEKASAKINDQLFLGTGEILFNKKELGLDLKSKVVNADIKKLAPQYQYNGLLTGTLDVSGALSNLHVMADLSAKKMAYKNAKLPDAKVKLTLSNKVVQINEFNLNQNDKNVNGVGWYNLQNGDFALAGKAVKFDLKSIASITNISLAGDVSGEFEIKGKNKSISSVKANVKGDNLSWRNYYVHSWRGQILGDGNNYAFNNFAGTLGDGYWYAQGDYRNNKLTVNAQAEHVSLADVGRMLNHEADGYASATANITYDLNNGVVVESDIASIGGSLYNIPFNGAAMHLGYKDKVIKISNGIVNTGKGTLFVSGDVGLFDNKPIDVNIKANHVRAEALLKVIPKKIPVTGWLDGNLQISGTIKDIVASGKIKLKEGSAWGQIISYADGKINYRGNELTVDEFVIKAYDSTINGRGTLIGNKLNFTGVAKDVDLERIVPNSTYKMQGKINASSQLTGTTDRIVFNGRIDSKDVLINNVELKDISSDVYYDPTVISIREASFKQADGTYKYSGGMRLKTKTLFGFANVKNGSLKEFLRITKIPIQNIDGKLNGEVSLGGKLNQPTIEIKGDINDTAINKVVMGTSNIDVKLDHGHFKINRLRVPVRAGFLAAAGEADLKGKVNMQIAASDVPIQYVVPLTGKNIPIAGMLDGIVNITGKTNDPKMQISTSVKNIAYNGTNIDKVYMLGTLQAGVVDINQILAQHGQYKVKLFGKFPLAALYNSNKIDKAIDNRMDVEVDLTEADLGALPLFTKFVTAGAGDTVGKIHITGPMDDINVEGKVGVKNGSITFKDTKKPLENINGELLFEGSKANLNIKANMGHGDMAVVGNASWGKGKTLDYNIDTKLNALEVQNTYFEGPLNADFAIVQENNRPKIMANVDLANDTINIPLEIPPSESTFDPLLDITVSAKDKPVRLYNSLLYDISAKGEWHFTGSKLNPQGKGVFESKVGTIKYLNNRFMVKAAKAFYSQKNTFLPDVDIIADTTVNDYRIKLGLSGSLEKLDLNLSSEPALSKEQIISLLTLRTKDFNTSQLQETAVNTIVSAGLQMIVLGSVENMIQSKLGLDIFTVTNNYLDPYKMKENIADNNASTARTPEMYYSLEVGKQIFPKFTLTYGMGLNYDLQKYGFSYNVNKHVGVESWATSDDNYYYGLKYKIQF